MSFKRNTRFIIIFLTILTGFAIILFGFDAYAMEKASKGRKLWDNILLLINFGILVFLFIKYARKPLLDFLRGVRGKIEETINSINEETKKVKSLLAVEEDKIKNIDEHIQEIRENIIEIGKREREQIIQNSRTAADKMIEDSQKEVEHSIELAKKRFGEEMLDMSISIAVERIKESITREENENIIDQFSTSLKTEKIRAV